MKLQNLPKDLLVELVSELQGRKEKEYSEYVVISICTYDDIILAWRFENEYKLKSWIAFELLSLPKSNNDSIDLFLDELRKTPLRNRSEYCKDKLRDIELRDLMNLLKQSAPEIVIIKGKCLSDNIDNIPLEY